MAGAPVARVRRAAIPSRAMPEVEIRPFSMDDAEALWRLFRQPGVLETTMTLPSQRLEQRRARYEALGDDDHMLVAIRHGEVAGTAALHVGTGRRRHAATLGIAVSVTHQRAGVGEALMLAVLDLADRWLGLRRLELGVLVGNEAARRLYERHGFEPEGVLRQAVACEGELRDELCMARLRPAMPGERGAALEGEASAEPPGAAALPGEASAEPPGETALQGEASAEPAAEPHAGIGSSASSP
jgi:putative acetyltransferase